MTPNSVIIRNGYFSCELFLTTELAGLSVSNWRQLLRLAMKDHDLWYYEWSESNGAALQKIRLFLPDIMDDAEKKARQAEKAYETGKEVIQATWSYEKRERTKAHNEALKDKAREARSKYKKLSKLLAAFVEETSPYIL